MAVVEPVVFQELRQSRKKRFGVRKSLKHKRGLKGTKLFAGGTAGCHGDRAGADGFSTCDVVRCIADNEHALRYKNCPVMYVGPAQRMRTKMVAVFGVISKSAKRK